MTRAVFPHIPDPADARPPQSPTADEIARIRAALPTGTPIMKGKWESMETAPRDGRPVWCRGEPNPSGQRFVYLSFWAYCERDEWLVAGTGWVSDPSEWLNPEAAP